MIYVICKNNPIIGNNHICDIKKIIFNSKVILENSDLLFLQLHINVCSFTFYFSKE